MIEVRTLLCSHHVDMAILCLSSLINFSSDPIKLVIHDDGSLTQRDIDLLKTTLKNIKIISRSEADVVMTEILKTYPHLRQERKKYALRLKLLDIPLMSTSDIAYCDTDILFFRPFHNLFCWPDTYTSAIFMIDNNECYSARPLSLLRNKNLKLPSRVNGGLFYMRKRDYDLDFVDWFLKQSQFCVIPFWTMQTCFAALAYRIGLKLWDSQQISIPSPRMIDDERVIAAHFVTPLRHLLSDFKDSKRCFSNQNSSVPIKVVSGSKECNILDLMKKQFVDYDRHRILNYLRSIKQKLVSRY